MFAGRGNLNKARPTQGPRRNGLEPGDPDVSAVRSIVDVEYAPDGSGLLLQGGFWEYADTLLMLPIGQEPAENNIFDPDRFWRDGSWAADSRSIILSGWDMAAYSDLNKMAGNWSTAAIKP